MLPVTSELPVNVTPANEGLSEVATACPIETAVPETPTPVPAVIVVMFALPSKETPWIVLAFARVVAVAAFPVVDWLSVPTVKSTVPSPSWYATVMPDSVLEVNIAPTVSCTTSDRSMFALPSKATP